MPWNPGSPGLPAQSDHGTRQCEIRPAVEHVPSTSKQCPGPTYACPRRHARTRARGMTQEGKVRTAARSRHAISAPTCIARRSRQPPPSHVPALAHKATRPRRPMKAIRPWDALRAWRPVCARPAGRPRHTHGPHQRLSRRAGYSPRPMRSSPAGRPRHQARLGQALDRARAQAALDLGLLQAILEVRQARILRVDRGPDFVDRTVLVPEPFLVVCGHLPQEVLNFRQHAVRRARGHVGRVARRQVVQSQIRVRRRAGLGGLAQHTLRAYCASAVCNRLRRLLRRNEPCVAARADEPRGAEQRLRPRAAAGDRVELHRVPGGIVAVHYVPAVAHACDSEGLIRVRKGLRPRSMHAGQRRSGFAL